MLILCTLFVTPVIAEDLNVLNPSSGDLGNVLIPGTSENPSSGNLGNVLNPGESKDIDLIPVSAGEVNVLSEAQTSLMQGQVSQVYRVALNCPGIVRMTPSYGARYNVYAKKNSASGNCPSSNSLRNNYDKVAYGSSGTTTMNLDSGVWCLMVYGTTGSGSYTLRVSSYCSQPTPYPTSTPTPSPCGVYKTDTRTGFLNQGQAAVYGYSIPSDTRSKIEWSMTSSGSCGGGNTPVIVASVGNPSIESTDCQGSSTFDLYVFKDCNPKNSRCTTRYYSNGPNSHVSVTSPSTGSTYYVMVYARSGSGTFDIKMNSYKCTSGNEPIIMAVSGVNTQVSAASQDNGSESEVSPPTADFILAEGAE
jgi:hypothetical protein